MSWVKIKDTNGNVLTVPETAFNDSFKNNGCVLVKDVKDKPVVIPAVAVAPMVAKPVAKTALKGKANPFKKS